MSGIEAAVAGRAVSTLAAAALLRCVGRESYQVPDRVRSSVLSDAARIREVREAAIEALREDGSDPERLLKLFVDGGRVAEATLVYWRGLGNFSRLPPEGRDHFGARVCRRLNDGWVRRMCPTRSRLRRAHGRL
jgi:hypothetical protein